MFGWTDSPITSDMTEEALPMPHLQKLVKFHEWSSSLNGQKTSSWDSYMASIQTGITDGDERASANLGRDRTSIVDSGSHNRACTINLGSPLPIHTYDSLQWYRRK